MSCTRLIKNRNFKYWQYPLAGVFYIRRNPLRNSWTGTFTVSSDSAVSVPSGSRFTTQTLTALLSPRFPTEIYGLRHREHCQMLNPRFLSRFAHMTIYYRIHRISPTVWWGRPVYTAQHLQRCCPLGSKLPTGERGSRFLLCLDGNLFPRDARFTLNNLRLFWFCPQVCGQAPLHYATASSVTSSLWMIPTDYLWVIHPKINVS